MIKQFLLVTLLSFCMQGTAHTHNNTPTDYDVDLVVYSYNRPLQAYAFFESLEKYATGFRTIHFVYRVDNAEYDAGYNELLARFSYVIPCKEQEPRATKSKPMIMQAAFGSPCSYLCFAVDDIIIKDHFDARDCTRAMEETGAYAFYLWMGKNINKCIMLHNLQTPPPALRHVRDDIFTWRFADGKGDWNYAHSNDMAIYRKNDIYKYFVHMQFTGPLYEGDWARYVDLKKMGLCYGTSKIVNIMMNLVQLEQPNWHSFSNEWKKKYDQFSPESLLKRFQEGLKIDIDTFYQFNNNDAHVEYEPTFIAR